MSVNAWTAWLVRAEVSWVSKPAWVAVIRASVALPWPAAAAAEDEAAWDWTCWRLSKRLPTAWAKPPCPWLVDEAAEGADGGVGGVGTDPAMAGITAAAPKVLVEMWSA